MSEYAVGLENVEPWTGELVEGASINSVKAGSGFEAGDVLFGKLRPYLAKVWSADRRGTYIGDFVCLRPRNGTHPKYLSYVLRTRKFIEQATAHSYGSKMPRVEWDTLKALPVPAPDSPTQKVVADYLDHETAEIDAFIAELAAMRSLMEERRDAERVWALTDGSADDQSGSSVPWAPDVHTPHPVRNIRRVAQMKTGHTPNRSTPAYWQDTTIPWFTLADVWQLRAGCQYPRETAEKISELGLAHSAAELLPSGTVMLSRTASVGFTGIMPRPMATSQDYWNWVCGANLLPEYLWHQFRAMHSQFKELMSGSTHKTIYHADAAGLRIVVPPVARQREIVELLGEEDTELTTMMRDADAAIDLARERRAALISAAVTGQIDVTQKHRPVAEQLEDEVKQLS
ncbi:restriction endonuclease subunit S [Nesterenkonia suensis]